MKISEELIKRAAKVLSQERANGHGVCPDPATFEEDIRVAARVFEAAFKDSPVDDGGSAFPCEGGVDNGIYADPGMRLRDWFAGQALPQFIMINERVTAGRDNVPYELALQVTAEQAYQVADAMIAARKAGA